MALSGTIYGPWLGSGYQRVYLTWSATQNIANNTSTITTNLYWMTTGYALSSSVAKDASVSIGGTVSGSTSSVTAALSNAGTKLLVSGSRTVAHNSDGTLSLNLSGTFVLRFTLGGTYYNSTTASGTVTLNTIPRSSSINSFPNFTIGSGVTVGITRASTSFTHTVTLKVGTTVISSKGSIATSVAFSAADLDSIYSRIPSATSTTATVYVTTYSGGTQIGSTISSSATASVGSTIIPTLSSVSASETVAALSGMMSAAHYLQNYSKIKFTINGASGVKSSSISSYKINFNGVNYGQNATTGTINATGAITATATVTDSRGRTSSARTVVCNLNAFPSGIGSFSNFNIGSGVYVSKARAANSSLTTKFVLTASGTNAAGSTGSFSVTAGNSAMDAYTFSAAQTAGLYTVTANTTSITVKLTATTHGASNTVIDTRTATATAYVESSIKPNASAVTLTSAEQNAITVAMALGSTTFVQGKSTIKFTAAGGTVGTGAGAALTRTINFNGTNYSSGATTGTHNLTGSKTATVTIVDSRGRSDSKGFTLTFLGYTAPSITQFTGVRRASPVTTVDMTAKGSITSLSSKNQLSYQISSRVKGGSWVVKTAWVNLAVGTTSLNIAPGYTGYDGTLSYDFNLELKDKYGISTVSTATIGTEQVTMSWGKYGIGVGKIHEQGALDVSGSVYVNSTLQDARKTVTTSVSTTNWYTIATGGSGRSYGEFVVSDISSGKHNVASFSASSSYGQNAITVTHGNRYAARTIAHARILYETADRVYGGAKLQIYCENPSFTFSVSMWRGVELDWGNWTLVTPIAEGTPAGWTQDVRVDDISSSADRYALPSHSHSYLPLSGGTITDDLILSNADYGNHLSISRPGVGLVWALTPSSDHTAHSTKRALRLLYDGNPEISFTEDGDISMGGQLNSNGILKTAVAQHTFNTPSGYIELGPKNTNYAHIYSDRPNFYFNKDILILGKRVITTEDNVFGSNSNGEFIKFDNGVMICYKSRYHTNPTWTAQNNVFRSYADVGDFAAVFTATPVVNVTLRTFGGAFMWTSGTTGVLNSTGMGPVSIFTTANITSTTLTVNIMAIGRWK